MIKTTHFSVHPLIPRLWLALAFALLLAWIILPSAGAASLDRPTDGLDAFVTDASETADSDGDGIGDNADSDNNTDVELVVLQEVFDALFCFAGEVEKESDTLYRFSCAGPPTHSTGAKIERFADAATAEAEFVTRAGTNPLESLKCYTAYSWSSNNEGSPIQRVDHSWLVDQWIVTSNTQDDTPHGFASASGTSYRVYQAAVGQNLIEGCEETYFPMFARE